MNNSTNGGVSPTSTPTSSGHPPPPSIQPTGSGLQLPGGMISALEHYRLTQLYQYAMAAERFRLPTNLSNQTTSNIPSSSQSQFNFQNPTGNTSSGPFRPELTPFLYSSYCRLDPRHLSLCRNSDEPKPQHSYIGLIAMAILGSPDKKLVLSDIYQYILDNYSYFRSRGPGWRNSIRHNLSLNDCFVKSGRSANGKGHYWAIHPANIDDFTKGDFRRRKAQRKVRRHMGLAVDDADSPSPPPLSPPPVNWPDPHHHHLLHRHFGHLNPTQSILPSSHHPFSTALGSHALGFNTSTGNAFEFSNQILLGSSRRLPQPPPPDILVNSTTLTLNINQFQKEKRRQFDVASLLAPENDIFTKTPSSTIESTVSPGSNTTKSEEEDIYSRSPSPPISPISNKKLSPISEVEISEDEDGEHGISGENTQVSTNQNQRSLTESSHFQFEKRLGSKVKTPQVSPVSTLQSDAVGQAQGASPYSVLLHQPLGLTSPHHPQHTVFHINPTTYPQQFFHQNPSLASLMILSSRYRELATGVTNQFVTTKKTNQ